MIKHPFTGDLITRPALLANAESEQALSTTSQVLCSNN